MPTDAPPRPAGVGAWKIAAAVIVAVVALNCVIAVLALRPALTTSRPASDATMTPRPVKAGEPFPASPLSFGPVIERVLTNDAALDLDSGKLAEKLPDYVREQDTITGNFLSAFAWMEQEGLDALFLESEGLYNVGMKLLRLKEVDWRSLPPAELTRRLESVNAAAPAGTRILGGTNNPAPLYGFQTREGGIGILQVAEHGSDSTRRVEIRYKLVKGRALGPSAVPAGDSSSASHLNQ